MLKLQKDEKVLFKAFPEVSMLVVWIFTRVLRVTLAIGFVLTMFLIPYASISQMKSGVESKAAILFGPFVSGPYLLVWILPFVITFIYHFFLRKTYEYHLTNQRAILKGGIIKNITRSIPFKKITDVEVSQNLVERIFGVSTLNIYTAGTGGAKAEIKFIGIKDAGVPEGIIHKMLKIKNNK